MQKVETTEMFSANDLKLAIALMLKLSFVYLDQHLPEKGHDEGRVHAAEAPYCADGKLSDFKHFVVQRNKQSLQILRLGEVCVEALVERR